MPLTRLVRTYSALVALGATLSPCLVDAQVGRAQTKTARASAAQSSTRSIATESHGPRLTIEPKRPPEGSLVRLIVDGFPTGDDSVLSIEGEIAGEPVHFVRAPGGRHLALGAIPVDASDSVVARVLLSRATGSVDTLRLSLRYPHRPPLAPAVSTAAKRSTPGPRLRVDPIFTRRLDMETEARIEHENELARDIGHLSQKTPRLWTLPFLRPRESQVTSRFGTGRVFNGRLQSKHLGIDYRGAKGEPIFAANRGVVALVAEFFLAGNVVYVNHGDGLVTGYFHMSESKVAVGDTVERGQQIGLVGATGRVTGPHLHWSARFGALTVNPGDLLKIGEPFAVADTSKRATVDGKGR